MSGAHGRARGGKTAVIHQPDFLPHLAFFHRLLDADVLVLLDTAQYVDGTSMSWMNRDRIKTAGGAKWLTVSVRRPPHGTPIREVRLSTGIDWRRKNLDLIRGNYRAAPYFDEILPHLEVLYRVETDRLSEFTEASIAMLMSLFGLDVPRVRASELHVEGVRNQLLADILGKIGADRYLSGVGARAYFAPEPFEQSGIEVVWQEFKHPVYPQLHGEFVSYLSSIDLLFNCGIVESRKLLRTA